MEPIKDGQSAIEKALAAMGGEQHRTALIFDLTPEQWNKDDNIPERVTRLATSLNRPDTLKADIFTYVPDPVDQTGGKLKKGVHYSEDMLKGALDGVSDPVAVLKDKGGYTLVAHVHVIPKSDWPASKQTHNPFELADPEVDDDPFNGEDGPENDMLD